MKKSELIIKTIDVPIFRGKFVVCIGFDEYDLPEIYQGIEKEERKIVYAHSLYLNIKESEDLFLECFMAAFNFKHHYRKITPGIISHEADHIATFICKERGIKSDNDNDECHSYIVEWIVDEICNVIKENKIEL